MKIAYEANKLLLYVDDVIEDISNYVRSINANSDNIHFTQLLLLQELTMDIKFCKEGCAVLKNALDDYVDLIDKSGIKA